MRTRDSASLEAALTSRSVGLDPLAQLASCTRGTIGTDLLAPGEKHYLVRSGLIFWFFGLSTFFLPGS
ncbi:MAG: hypothetical protein HKN13_07745 [Rhodothermales bacterium]|nr:hypothetical protein [Rhodothermales bacterium]